MWHIILGWNKDEVQGTKSRAWKKKTNGTCVAVPLDFLRNARRILGPVVQFVTKRWMWALKLCTSCRNVSFILGNTNI
jgi:hypothetical protein